jgi:glycosyltransferase involved in cell wall biosynthesis/GT2 family glycosyltransferase/predicted SAM-dependent methyltransferase
MDIKDNHGRVTSVSTVPGLIQNWPQGKPLRLHLGCGQRRLEGYVNIDFPPSEHTVQQSQAADIFADITQLDFPSKSIDEIRLHHVFEHFDRPAALALLCKWHQWLKSGGCLVVETPDFDASIDLIRSGQCTYPQKQAILRHLFGSHEADWAIHKDGWYGEKFQSVFSRLGFDNIHIELSSWGLTRNITVSAVKSRVVPLITLTEAAKQILCDSMIDQSETEQKQWTVWCQKLQETLSNGCQGETKPPKVSIFMSMYNTAQYLPETIDSLIAQTFTDWELIIVDDGSADNSLEVARKYQTRDNRIRVSGIPHVGVVKARNEALRQCHPEAVYLMNHDSDDISLPDKLCRLVEYLDKNPEIAIVGCFAVYFGDGSVGKKPPYLEWQPQKIRQTFGEFNSMIHSAAMMRHEVVRKIGCYRDHYPPAEDYEFFALALMAGFECANIPEVLHHIRLHRKSLSAVHTQVQQAHAETIKANYRQYLKTVNPVPMSHASSGSSLSILHTVEFYAPHTGGAEEVVQQISQRLAKRGHRVTVATTKLPQRNFSELNGVRILEFDIAGNYARGFQGRDINPYVQLVRSDQFDVMFNYAAQQWATDLAFAGLEPAATKRVNVIAPCGYSALSDAKTLRLPQYAKYFNSIIPACLPRYDAAVYHSAMYKDYEFAINHGFTNSVVIPNGTSEEEFSTPSTVDFRQKYGISTKYFGLCVANFFAGKGHPTVIEAVRQMRRSDFTLVFIGKEGQHLPELQKLAAGLNIRFCVNIPRQDTVAAYQAADIFLFGSEIEASPLVIIEAKASRTPFVTTDVGNVREWKGGIVCTPENMAHHANALLDNEPMRKALALEGFGEWKDKLTWESVADRYEQLYLSLKNTKQKGLPNDFNHFQQRPGFAACGDHRVVSAALPGY